MTVLELAERDLRKARINLEQAQNRPNVPMLEISNLARLCILREQIVEILREAEG